MVFSLLSIPSIRAGSHYFREHVTAHLSAVSLHAWVTIWTVVIFATAGDILIAAAMRRLGDLDEIREKSGLGGAIKAVVTSPFLGAGIGCMAVSFFALLYALSAADLSLIAPATASLTYIATSAGARVFLKEHVDKRRWIAALFVCAGVALLTQ